MTGKAKGPEHDKLGGWLPDEARQHFKTAREEMRKSWQALLPPSFFEHRRAARREALLAARTLIEHALKRLEDGSG
ncbi:MAG TPA: hypothetical protein VJ123_03075 [Anaerolineales bacterium]|nr:hypothetical protein [Anaerolineales bacterium]